MKTPDSKNVSNTALLSASIALLTVSVPLFQNGDFVSGGIAAALGIVVALIYELI